MEKKGWKRIELDILDHQMNLLKDSLADQGIFIVLRDSVNPTAQYYEHLTSNVGRVFFVKEEQYSQAKTLIEKFVKDQELGSEDLLAFSEYSKYVYPTEEKLYIKSQKAVGHKVTWLFFVFVFLSVFYYIITRYY